MCPVWCSAASPGRLWLVGRRQHLAVCESRERVKCRGSKISLGRRGQPKGRADLARTFFSHGSSPEMCPTTAIRREAYSRFANSRARRCGPGRHSGDACGRPLIVRRGLSIASSSGEGTINCFNQPTDFPFDHPVAVPHERIPVDAKLGSSERRNTPRCWGLCWSRFGVWTRARVCSHSRPSGSGSWSCEPAVSAAYLRKPG